MTPRNIFPLFRRLTRRTGKPVPGKPAAEKWPARAPGDVVERPDESPADASGAAPTPRPPREPR